MTKTFVFIVLVPVLRTLELLGIRRKRILEFKLCMFSLGTLLSQIASRNGKVTAAKCGKAWYLVAKRLALGLPPLSQSAPLWWKTRKGCHLPEKLWRLERLLLRRGWWYKKIALLILSSYQLVTHKPEVDLQPQLGPSDFKEPVGLFEGFSSLRSTYNLGRLSPIFSQPEIWIGSSGPQGGPSLLNASVESFLTGELSNPLLDLTEMLQEVRKVRFDSFEAMGALSSMRRRLRVDIGKRPIVPTLARQIVLSEGGGKSRAVTPVSYTLQVFLRPFHNYFMECLRRIPMDCSFNEELGKKWVQTQTAKRLPLWSFDLSNATDRFPIWVIARVVVSQLLNPSFAERWVRIMRLPIAYKTPRNNHIVSPYAVGAPMGIYSLWPAYTLCHHAMVACAARLSGYKGNFTLYRIRGDDIVIADRKVARQYIKLTDQLSLEVSKGKSFYWERDGPGVAEFAKRIFFNGKEVCFRPIKEVRAAGRHDPFVVLPVLLDIFGMFDAYRVRTVLAKYKGNAPDFVFGCFLNKSRKLRLLEWVGVPWNESLRNSFRPYLSLDVSPSWGIIPPSNFEYIKEAGMEIIRRNLIYDLEESVEEIWKKGPVRKEHVTHPFNRFIERLKKEIETLSVRTLTESPAERDSRIILACRQIQGVNLRDVSRRNVRRWVASKYLGQVALIGMRTMTRQSFRIGYW
jgi:hypothetical protein